MRYIDGLDENDDVDSVVVLLPALWILNDRNDAICINRNYDKIILYNTLYDYHWISLVSRCVVLLRNYYLEAIGFSYVGQRDK